MLAKSPEELKDVVHIISDLEMRYDMALNSYIELLSCSYRQLLETERQGWPEGFDNISFNEKLWQFLSSARSITEKAELTEKKRKSHEPLVVLSENSRVKGASILVESVYEYVSEQRVKNHAYELMQVIRNIMTHSGLFQNAISYTYISDKKLREASIQFDLHEIIRKCKGTHKEEENIIAVTNALCSFFNEYDVPILAGLYVESISHIMSIVRMHTIPMCEDIACRLDGIRKQVGPLDDIPADDLYFLKSENGPLGIIEHCESLLDEIQRLRRKNIRPPINSSSLSFDCTLDFSKPAHFWLIFQRKCHRC